MPSRTGSARPRDAFQRDRDRIVHSIAFRRLRHKTQVFVAPDGDHYRVRLTHSLEVAQIGRTIARALGLNEDLTEALCLAHDLGHPPFGHAGEDALDEALRFAGGFDHNGHTLRLVCQLETPYPDFDGLNLSWETLEGLAKHNGPVAEPGWALAEVDAAVGLELGSHASLEAQVAAIADDIAYDNHDIDDGLRAGVLPLDVLLELPFVARHWDAIERRWPDLSLERKVKALVRDQIGTMVGDLLAETRRRVAEAGSRRWPTSAPPGARWPASPTSSPRGTRAQEVPLRQPLQCAGAAAGAGRGAAGGRQSCPRLPRRPAPAARRLAPRRGPGRRPQRRRLCRRHDRSVRHQAPRGADRPGRAAREVLIRDLTPGPPRGNIAAGAACAQTQGDTRAPMNLDHHQPRVWPC
jgi:hypothetical protein